MFVERYIFEKEWPPRASEPPRNLDLRCHASTLAELPNGDLIAAWWEGTYETAPDVVVAGARLAAGSESWSGPVVLADTPGKAEGNAVLFASPGGRLWLFYVTMYGQWWNQCKIHYKTSDDGGHTWSESSLLRDELGWMLRNKPLVLSSGRIVLPVYRESSTSDQVNNHSLMLLSDDGGQTWVASEPIRSMPPNLQPTVIERSDGSLLALCRYYVYPVPDENGRIWKSTSRDGGETWSPASRTALLNPNAAIDMIKTASGNLVLAFNDATNKRTPLKIALSQDEGETWPVQKAVETAEGAYDYPAIIQSNDGLIHLTYSYNHLTIKHVTFDEEWIQT
jgi:predicted neuraminidase